MASEVGDQYVNVSKVEVKPPNDDSSCSFCHSSWTRWKSAGFMTEIGDGSLFRDPKDPGETGNLDCLRDTTD